MSGGAEVEGRPIGEERIFVVAEMVERGDVLRKGRHAVVMQRFQRLQAGREVVFIELLELVAGLGQSFVHRAIAQYGDVGKRLAHGFGDIAEAIAEPDVHSAFLVALQLSAAAVVKLRVALAVCLELSDTALSVSSSKRPCSTTSRKVEKA